MRIDPGNFIQMEKELKILKRRWYGSVIKHQGRKSFENNRRNSFLRSYFYFSYKLHTFFVVILINKNYL